MPKKPVIFISYSYLDEPDRFLNPGSFQWLTYVKSHLDPAQQHGLLEVWKDRRIDGGGDCANFGLALTCTGNVSRATEYARIAQTRLDEAVLGLWHAGTRHHLPRALLARATFRCAIGDWGSAVRDLDEVQEIAEPGRMKLYLCDLALGRARLAFARSEAFLPLTELLGGKEPAEIQAPNAADMASVSYEAAKHLAIGHDIMTKCGYHRRAEELAELESVLKGQRRFADLLPRV